MLQWILGYKYLSEFLFSIFLRVLMIGIAVHRAIVCLDIRNHQTIPWWSQHFTLPPEMYEDSSFSTSWPTLVLFFFFLLIVAILVVWSYYLIVVLTWISLLMYYKLYLGFILIWYGKTCTYENDCHERRWLCSQIPRNKAGMTHQWGLQGNEPALATRQRGRKRGDHGSEHIVLGFSQEGRAGQKE